MDCYGETIVFECSDSLRHASFPYKERSFWDARSAFQRKPVTRRTCYAASPHLRKVSDFRFCGTATEMLRTEPPLRATFPNSSSELSDPET